MSDLAERIREQVETFWSPSTTQPEREHVPYVLGALVLSEVDTLLAGLAALEAEGKMREALEMVAEEIVMRVAKPLDDSWNADFPVEMSLTIRDCRTVLSALAQPAPEQPKG